MEPNEEFLWIATYGDQKNGMRMHFGKSIDDPIPFILTVTPRYVSNANNPSAKNSGVAAFLQGKARGLKEDCIKLQAGIRGSYVGSRRERSPMMDRGNCRSGHWSAWSWRRARPINRCASS